MKYTDYNLPFLFGAAYYDEYMPYDRIDIDFQMMKDAGMNVVRIAESTWSTWEPEEGVFDFSHLHRMLDAAEKYDMNVIIGTPTYAVPSWLAKKYPKILALSKSGQELYGRRQNIDITNPDFRRHAGIIIRRLMEECASHPKVIGFQLDNETRSAGAASLETQALFIERMKERYPDIKEFNHEFGLDYWSNRVDNWDDFPDIRGTINGSLSAAYKRFLRDVISEYLMWQRDIVREYASSDQFITHNFDFSWIEYSHGIQPEVDQRNAGRAVDIAGVDIYHLTQDKLDGATIAFGGAVGRNIKKGPYFVLETQSQGRLNWLPYPKQHRLQAYSHLASGSASLMYWNWHSIHNSFESYWRGILSHDLAPNAAYSELAAFRKEELSLEDRITVLKKMSNVAIVVDNASLTGIDEFPISDSLNYNSILRWFYNTLYKMNIECELVYKGDPIDSYKLVIVPALYSANDIDIEWLKSYSKAGGQLLIGFKSFFSDDELKIYHDAQPHGIASEAGVTYNQFTIPDDNCYIEFTSEEVSAYKVTEWMELLRPVDADIWAYYKHPEWGDVPAITHKETSPGGGITYLGCYMEQSGLISLINKLCNKAKIDAAYCNPASSLIVRKGKNRYGNEINFIFNYSGSPAIYHHTGSPGRLLLENGCLHLNDEKEVKPGENIPIEKWDLLILEIPGR